MKILDRYVLTTFIKNYLISFMVLIGLYVVLHMMFNFDELNEGQRVNFDEEPSPKGPRAGNVRGEG